MSEFQGNLAANLVGGGFFGQFLEIKKYNLWPIVSYQILGGLKMKNRLYFAADFLHEASHHLVISLFDRIE